MSLLDKLLDTTEDKGPDWIKKAVSSAKELAADHFNGPEADAIKIGLDKIGNHSDELAHLGQGGLVALIARYTVGEKQKTKLLYLSEGATFEERIAASRASTSATVHERVNREIAWEAVQTMLQDLGKIAWKLIPLLLAV